MNKMAQNNSELTQLEQKLKPEVRQKLEQVYDKGQCLLRSGFVNEESGFQQALGDFYDLEWVTKTDFYGRHTYSYSALDKREEEDPSKLGRVPRDLITTLEGFNREPIVGKVVSNIDELIYEKIRDSWNQGEFSHFREYCNASFGLVGLIGGSICLVASGEVARNSGNWIHLSWGIAGALSGYTLAMYSIYKNWGDKQKARDDVPKEIQNRKKAFDELHEISKEADGLMKEYKEYFPTPTDI